MIGTVKLLKTQGVLSSLFPPPPPLFLYFSRPFWRLFKRRGKKENVEGKRKKKIQKMEKKEKKRQKVRKIDVVQIKQNGLQKNKIL